VIPPAIAASSHGWCTGSLSLPLVDGIERFKGVSCHTAKWPHEPVSFEGKRVAVIGTGATGIQTIQEVAKTAAHLTVYQRTANWCAPLHNRKITDDEQRAIKAGYAEIFQRCSENPGGFIHKPDPRSALEVSREEREAFWEQRYAEPGFGIWIGNYRDLVTNRESTALISDFIARKVRERTGFLPEERGLYKRMTPVDAIAFFAGLKGMGDREARRRAKEMLEEQGLGAAMSRPIKES
jgi:cation diffusion facilitator CzcD-associated flavoprotein CzcO